VKWPWTYPLLVVGMGKSARSFLRLLESAGAKRKKDFYCYDDDKSLSDFECSPADFVKNNKIKVLVLSPGYPLKTAWIQEVKDKLRVENQMTLLLPLLKQQEVISVTGSVGKSTVVTAIHNSLEQAGFKSFLAGNIGTPLSEFFLEKNNSDYQKVVLEFSSYQLELKASFHSNYSVFTPFMPNHMDRYSSLEEYYRVKSSLAAVSGKIISHENNRSFLEFLSEDELAKVHFTKEWKGLSRITGVHNIQNLSLAKKLGELAAWPESYFESLKNFRGLPHRLEAIPVTKIAAAYNDSKSTTVNGVLVSLKEVLKKETAKVYCLVGGKDKNHDWSPLKKVEEKRLHWIPFGASSSLLKDLLSSEESFSNLSEALSYLQSTLQPSDVLLLSPGGASQDEFISFEERGNFFKKQVRLLWS